MPRLKVERFAGLAPKFDRRQLPLGAAQVSENCRFDSGDLKGYFDLAQVDDGSGLIGTSTADLGNVFYYRSGNDIRNIGFGDFLIVSAARTPVPSDKHKRWYWCVRGETLYGISLATNFAPRPNGGALGSGTFFRQFGGYKIGIPAPKLKPEASAIASDLEAVGFGTDTSITSISRTNPVTINLSGGHDFEAGQTVTIKIDEALPRPADPGGGGTGLPPGGGGSSGSTVGQVWTLDGLSGTVSNVTDSSFEISGVSTTNFSDFDQEDIGAVRVERTLQDDELEDRFYVFTYVSEFDEEGPPSPASNIISVGKGGRVSLTISDEAHVLDTDGGSREMVNRIRVYRSVSGQDSQLVRVGTLQFAGGTAEDGDLEWVDPPSTINPELDWTADLTDFAESAALGDTLQSAGWFPPPRNLEGIVQFDNGIMVGWVGNTLHYSEPYLPHAWNPDHTDTLQDDVVGCQSVSGLLVIGTRGRPYVASGADPASMRSKRLEVHAPLLGQRLICDAGSGVVYVADNGLMFIGPGGSQWLTEARYDKETWLAAVSPYDRAVYHDRRIILYAPDTDPLVFSMEGGAVEASYLPGIQFSAAYVADTHLTVIVRQDAPNNPARLRRYFNEGDTRLTARWRSGIIKVTRPVNWAVAQVLADGYPLTFRFRHIRPDSYPEPVAGQPDMLLLEREFEVLGPEPFWLPSDYLSREFELELESQHRVQELAMATSMEELVAS